MTIRAIVKSIFEKVSIDWLAEEPLDTVVRTGKYSAAMVDNNGNRYEIPVDNADVLNIGDQVFLQIN